MRRTRTPFTRSAAARDESGAVLILAFIFLLVVGVTVGSLADWATNDLDNTAHFTSARSLQYSTESAVELAMQNMRTNPLLPTPAAPTPTLTLNASPPAPCFANGSSTPPAVNGASAAVWCSTEWNPTSAATRVVTFSACPVTPGETSSSCAANPYLQAVVTYDDYPAGGITAPTTPPVPCTVYCGTTMTVNSWEWSPVVPIVTGIAPATGLITGGASVVISGSGFVSGATVNFVEASGNPLAPSGNVILPATVTAVGANSITARSPAVIVGTTYFVTVTTPGGTSAYSANDVFTYSATSVVPAISSISTKAGSTFGGTAVTITGIGFYTGATVKFVAESGGVLGASIPAVEHGERADQHHDIRASGRSCGDLLHHRDDSRRHQRCRTDRRLHLLPTAGEPGMKKPMASRRPATQLTDFKGDVCSPSQGGDVERLLV